MHRVQVPIVEQRLVACKPEICFGTKDYRCSSVSGLLESTLSQASRILAGQQSYED